MVDTLKGHRSLVSFYRFATCPFCNLRMHRLIGHLDSFGPGFQVVAVFNSPHEAVWKTADRHSAPFPVLADATGEAYRRFGVSRSLGGVLKGMILRMPDLMRSMFVEGNWPFPIQGNMLTMPLDLLIDETGRVVTAYYGKDEGDHLPIEDILAFSEG